MNARWAAHAPCQGLDGFTIRDDQWKTATDIKRLCGPQLPTCGRCSFRAECIATVKPAQAKFDGIAGGRLWCNGEVIDALDDVSDDELAEPKLRASCGTEAGAKDHDRRGEARCLSCRQVVRAITQRRVKAAAANKQLQLELDVATA